MSEKYPHVNDVDMAIIDRFRDKFRETGGNEPEDLLNDLRNPNSRNFASVNLPRFVLAVAVQAQVLLLKALDLPPEPKGSTVIGFYDGELPIVVGVVAGNVDVNGGHNGWSLWADHVEESDPEQAAIDAVGARLSRDMGQDS